MANTNNIGSVNNNFKFNIKKNNNYWPIESKFELD